MDATDLISLYFAIRFGIWGPCVIFILIRVIVIPQILVMVRKKGKQAHLESAVQWIVVCCVREG